jgi:hypothetical protein
MAHGLTAAKAPFRPGRPLPACPAIRDRAMLSSSTTINQPMFSTICRTPMPGGRGASPHATPKARPRRQSRPKRPLQQRGLKIPSGFRLDLPQNPRDAPLDRLLRHVAHDLVRHLAALEDQQRRNPTDPVPHRRRLVVVHVHLRHLQAPAVLRRHLIHDRRQRPARSAPRCPKVHQNRLLRLQNLLVKRRITYFSDPDCCHLSRCPL